jgi:hypothetical protein
MAQKSHASRIQLPKIALFQGLSDQPLPAWQFLLPIFLNRIRNSRASGFQGWSLLSNIFDPISKYSEFSPKIPSTSDDKQTEPKT